MKGCHFNAGWLEQVRVKALMAVGVPTTPQRSAGEIIWDARLSELLAYKAMYGTCRSDSLPPPPPLLFSFQ